MSRTSARSVAWDPVGGRVLVVVQQGTNRFLSQWTSDGKLRGLRKLPKDFEHFRVEAHDGVAMAVYADDDAIRFLPLEGGRAKKVTLDGSISDLTVFRGCEPRWRMGTSILDVSPNGARRLDGTGAEGEVWAAGVKGLFRRATGGTDWDRVADTNTFVKTIAATDDLLVVGCYDGTRVVVTGDQVITHKGKPVWWAVAHGGAVFGKVDYDICRFEPDGTDVCIGSLDPDHLTYMDHCLFSTPEGLFFVIGETMHRYDGNDWQEIVVSDAFTEP